MLAGATSGEALSMVKSRVVDLSLNATTAGLTGVMRGGTVWEVKYSKVIHNHHSQR